MTTVLRGYVIRTHQAGEPSYNTSAQKVWSEKGTLPEEWAQVKQDETIDAAQLYTNAQSHVKAGKRRILDSKGA